MFNRKECMQCGEKSSKDYSFCPHCGNSFEKKSVEMGMLGRNDDMNKVEDFTKSLLGGFGGGILNKMIKNTVKMLEKEMQKEMTSQKQFPKSNFQLFVNGKKISTEGLPQLNTTQQTKTKDIRSVHFSDKNQKKFLSLPQKEPKTNVRRLSNGVLYEIELEGVKLLEDISLVKLENSIEIKAIAPKKAYFKSIPISLPLVNYEFDKNKLLLEFGVKN